MVLACLLGLMVLVLARATLAWQERQVQFARVAVSQARAQLASEETPKANAPDSDSSSAGTDLAQWSPRTEADEVVRQAGETALVHGITLRTLSMSHQPASAQAWGRVMLDVSASGSYEALKAWQATMQQRFSALSVQSLRLQGSAPGGVVGGLDAQAVWVLHVRD